MQQQTESYNETGPSAGVETGAVATSEKAKRVPSYFVLVYTNNDGALNVNECNTRNELKTVSNSILADGGHIETVYRGARKMSVKVNQVASF